MLKLSTGLRNAMLGTVGARGALNGGLLKIYAGTIPSTADDALGSATLLATYSLNGAGGGISFDAPVNGVLSKAAAETWGSTAVATGTATFFRFVTTSDTGADSTSFARLQGSVGQAGFDLDMSNPNITNAQVLTPISSFNVRLPTL